MNTTFVLHAPEFAAKLSEPLTIDGDPALKPLAYGAAALARSAYDAERKSRFGNRAVILTCTAHLKDVSILMWSDASHTVGVFTPRRPCEWRKSGKCGHQMRRLLLQTRQPKD